MPFGGFSKEGLGFLTEQIHSDRFVAWCMTRLAACAPIHHWLVKHNP